MCVHKLFLKPDISRNVFYLGSPDDIVAMTTTFLPQGQQGWRGRWEFAVCSVCCTENRGHKDPKIQLTLIIKILTKIIDVLD